MFFFFFQKKKEKKKKKRIRNLSNCTILIYNYCCSAGVIGGVANSDCFNSFCCWHKIE